MTTAMTSSDGSGAAGDHSIPNWRVKALVAAIALLTAAHLVQLASPLRLTPDAVNYLAMADGAARGNGFTAFGRQTHFPHGYPAMLRALHVVGAARPWGIVGLNCLLFAIALVAAYGVHRRAYDLDRWQALLLCVVTMVSYVSIKHVAVPLSDIAFLATAMGCVLCATIAQRQDGARRWLWRCGAALIAAGAIHVRTTGIALLPVVAASFLPSEEPLARMTALLRRHRVLSGLALAVSLAAAVICACAVMRTTYFGEMKLKYTEHGTGRMARTVLNYRITEAGQIASNVPYTALPARLRMAFPFVGCLALAAAGVGAWVRRRRLGPPDVYVLAHFGILSMWPYWDARFWLPVLPLLAGHVAEIARWLRCRRLTRGLAAAYLLLYVSLGLATFGYSIRLSLSGDRFSEIYHDAQYRDTYRAALGGGQPPRPDRVNPRALEVLRRYDPGAQRPQAAEQTEQNSP